MPTTHEMEHDHVYIAPSEGKGMGVFAKHTISKGTMVCYFDGKKVIDDKKVHNHLVDLAYFINRPTGGVLVGYRTPRHVNGVGQLVNDGAMFRLEEEWRNDDGVYSLSDERIKCAVTTYITTSKERSNVDFRRRGMKLYATRDINAHEELYSYYGMSAWLQHFQFVPEPLTRLVCLGLLGKLYTTEPVTSDVGGSCRPILVMAIDTSFTPLRFLEYIGIPFGEDHPLIERYGLKDATPLEVVRCFLRLVS